MEEKLLIAHPLSVEMTVAFGPYIGPYYECRGLCDGKCDGGWLSQEIVPLRATLTDPDTELFIIMAFDGRGILHEPTFDGAIEIADMLKWTRGYIDESDHRTDVLPRLLPCYKHPQSRIVCLKAAIATPADKRDPRRVQLGCGRKNRYPDDGFLLTAKFLDKSEPWTTMARLNAAYRRADGKLIIIDNMSAGAILLDSTTPDCAFRKLADGTLICDAHICGFGWRAICSRIQ